jgi:hypothetical protein
MAAFLGQEDERLDVTRFAERRGMSRLEAGKTNPANGVAAAVPAAGRADL